MQVGTSIYEHKTVTCQQMLSLFGGNLSTVCLDAKLPIQGNTDYPMGSPEVPCVQRDAHLVHCSGASTLHWRMPRVAKRCLHPCAMRRLPIDPVDWVVCP